MGEQIPKKGRLTLTEQEIKNLQNLSCRGVVEIKNLYKRDEEIHKNTVNIYNSAGDEFQNVNGRFAAFETRLAGIEGTLQEIVAHLQR